MTFEDWALKPTGDLVGYSVGAAAAGVRDGKPSRLDVALIVSELPCAAAGVFTTNQVIAAPCIVTRRHLERGPLRAIVVNSGNANACTGEQGERDAIAMAEAAADKIGCDPHEVAVASTGVIGVPLPVERIASAIRSIDLRKDAWDDVARAMMTTDTRPKSVRRDYPLGTLGSPETVHFRGVAKGAGMIHPNMATMLAFIVCDADIDAALMRQHVPGIVARTFNRISVDGDTSTNDMVLVLTSLASLGRGKFAPSPAEVFAHSAMATRTHMDLTNSFLEATLLLLPLDIWLRRRTWKRCSPRARSQLRRW